MSTGRKNPRSTVVNVRVGHALLTALQTEAKKRGVPYTGLFKEFAAERLQGLGYEVEEEAVPVSMPIPVAAPPTPIPEPKPAEPVVSPPAKVDDFDWGKLLDEQVK